MYMSMSMHSQDAMFTHALNILKNLPTQLLFAHFLNIHHPYGTPTPRLVNKTEMVQRRAARFCHIDYKTIKRGCVSEMIRKLNLEPLNIRRTNKRLTIFHKAINGHLALPIGHLEPVLRLTGHLNSKAYNTIHTRNDCYKYSFFPRTIK